MSKLVVVGVLLACIAGCGGGGGGGGGNPAAPAPAPPAPPPPSGLFNVVSGAVWNETAVRQVLHTFAFGGHASDSQVAAWAAMHPLLATREILVLTPRHDLLSPPDPIDELADKDATLEEVAAYWASDDPTNLVDQQFRYLFDATQPNMFIAAELTWGAMTTKFGVNPIRQRIGLFETNYHMVVHQLIGNINDLQLMRYYDNIVNAQRKLADQRPWKIVLTDAAGEFCFEHVSSTAYRVRASLPGFEAQSRAVSSAFEVKARDTQLLFQLNLFRHVLQRTERASHHALIVEFDLADLAYVINVAAR